MHARSSANGLVQHTAAARVGGSGGGGGSPALLMPCGGGTIPAADLPGLLNTISTLLSATADKGQHAPDCVHAAAEVALRYTAVLATPAADSPDALKKLQAAVRPRGGTTDVGQHKGHDTARCTTWPLVRAALQVCTCARRQIRLFGLH